MSVYGCLRMFTDVRWVSFHPLLSELHNLNLKLCSKQYNKINTWHLIVVPQLSGGWQQNCSTKTRQVGYTNESSLVYSLMSMCKPIIVNVDGITLTNWLSNLASIFRRRIIATIIRAFPSCQTQWVGS
jgi:hypothetical protein